MADKRKPKTATTPKDTKSLPFVVETDERPANKGSGVCFYCQQKIGTPHKYECVSLSKWVLVRMTAEIPMEMPLSWDKDRVEFKLNEGTWCADNIIDDLQGLVDKGLDLCTVTEFEYIRDGKVIDAEVTVTDLVSERSDATTNLSNPQEKDTP